jgi:hypothetical protein
MPPEPGHSVVAPSCQASGQIFTSKHCRFRPSGFTRSNRTPLLPMVISVRAGTMTGAGARRGSPFSCDQDGLMRFSGQTRQCQVMLKCPAWRGERRDRPAARSFSDGFYRRFDFRWHENSGKSCFGILVRDVCGCFGRDVGRAGCLAGLDHRTTPGIVARRWMTILSSAGAMWANRNPGSLALVQARVRCVLPKWTAILSDVW